MAQAKNAPQCQLRPASRHGAFASLATRAPSLEGDYLATSADDGGDAGPPVDRTEAYTREDEEADQYRDRATVIFVLHL